MSQYGRLLSLVVATTIGVGSGPSLSQIVLTLNTTDHYRRLYLQAGPGGAEEAEGKQSTVVC